MSTKERKNMIKNKTILFLLLISIFVFVGCKEQKPDKEENVLKEFVDTITFEENLNADLDLQEEYNYKNKNLF